jgi:hypothetical protein
VCGSATQTLHGPARRVIAREPPRLQVNIRAHEDRISMGWGSDDDHPQQVAFPRHLVENPRRPHDGFIVGVEAFNA